MSIPNQQDPKGLRLYDLMAAIYRRQAILMDALGIDEAEYMVGGTYFTPITEMIYVKNIEITMQHLSPLDYIQNYVRARIRDRYREIADKYDGKVPDKAIDDVKHMTDRLNVVLIHQATILKATIHNSTKEQEEPTSTRNCVKTLGSYQFYFHMTEDVDPKEAEQVLESVYKYMASENHTSLLNPGHENYPNRRERYRKRFNDKILLYPSVSSNNRVLHVDQITSAYQELQEI